MIDILRDGGLTIVTLNRPKKANSLTAGMLGDLARAVNEMPSEANLRALILTGAGDKVFSAGADLDEARAGLATSPLWEEVSGAIAALPCLTVAALNGTLAGGAFGMALACDIRVAAAGARFFYPVAKLGFLPQPSDPGRLRDLVGPARAKLLLLGAQTWTAEEAQGFGLVDLVVPQGQAVSAAREIAAASLEGQPEILHGIKRMCAG